jgi:hypothetical protein
MSQLQIKLYLHYLENLKNGRNGREEGVLPFSLFSPFSPPKEKIPKSPIHMARRVFCLATVFQG